MIDRSSNIWRFGLAAALPGGILGVLAALGTYLVQPLYLSGVSFSPDAPSRGALSSLGALGSLAGQLGLGGLTESSQSLAFYGYLAQTPDVLSRVVTWRIPPEIGAPDSTLEQMWYGDVADHERRTFKATRRLSGRLTVRSDERTGILTVGILAESPALAQWATQVIYQELNRYNISVRQTRAQSRRQFLEARVGEARDSLRAAEAALATFYERNRQFQDSPELVSAERQLSRKVDARLEIYTALQRELETARLDEVRDTPVLSVIQAPSRPVYRARPGRTRTTLLFALLGAVIGLSVEVGRPWSARLWRKRPT